jgi:16S rRNA G966 N2-methylase RsmD
VRAVRVVVENGELFIVDVIGPNAVIEMPTESEPVVVVNGDCLEVLRAMPADSVDLVLTDPPYNCGKEYGNGCDDERKDYIKWLGKVFGECRRVSRDAVVYTPGTSNVFTVAKVLGIAKLKPVRMLGWHRREFAGDKWAGGPAFCWEPVVWASKAGKPHFNRIFGHWGRDFLVVPCVRQDPARDHHPCPKPPAVMRWLLKMFAPAGGTVLDPFGGSGTVGAEAVGEDLRAILIEQNPEFCEYARRRSNEAMARGPGQLFGT